MNKSNSSFSSDGNCLDSSSNQPQDLSCLTPSPQQILKSPVNSTSSVPTSTITTQNHPNVTATALTNSLQQILPQNFMDNFCMQNLHLAQIALYHQNPFYYQNIYPFLGSQAVAAANLSLNQAELFKSQFEVPCTNNKLGSNIIINRKNEECSSSNSIGSGLINPPEIHSPRQFPFVDVAAAAAAATALQNTSSVSSISNVSTSDINTSNCMLSTPNTFLYERKRKATTSDDYGQLMETIPTKKLLKTNKQGNFKIFKDEPIPHGYLKFRFNEDCNFPNCGYRNHQSHFHCCRNDCYYSFCDKTRFVQHTARHERLDKLMGDDFKQYRANMKCGYENCAYNKNIGKILNFLFFFNFIISYLLQ